MSQKKQPNLDTWVKKGKLVLPDSALIYADGTTYSCRVLMLCGQDCAEIDCQSKEQLTVAEFMRRLRLVSSISHVTRRACKKCLEQYQHGISIAERKWLYQTNPQLGPMLGVDLKNEIVTPAELRRRSGEIQSKIDDQIKRSKRR